MRAQRLGMLGVALLLGGSVSVSLFAVMVFLIKPEKSAPHGVAPTVVTLAYIEPKTRPGKPTEQKHREMPKPGPAPESVPLAPTPDRKIRRRRIKPPVPGIHLIGLGDKRLPGQLNLEYAPVPFSAGKGTRSIRFHGVAPTRLHLRPEKAPLPERTPTPGGGEIDRIGADCFEVSGLGAGVDISQGQTSQRKNQDRAIHSLAARQVSCDGNHSISDTFSRELKSRGLIPAPAPRTR